MKQQTSTIERSENSSDILYDSALTLIFLRNEFYKITYHRLLLTLLVSFLFNIAMIVITYYLAFEEIPPIYFPTDPNGRLLDEAPLDEPILTDREVRTFAIKAAQSITSFDYLNFRRDLQLAREYFTERGFESYIKALDDSKNLTTVRSEQLVTRGELAGDINMRTQISAGRYLWYIDVPMNIRYSSSQMKILQPVTVHLLIGRVSTTQSLYAVQAAQVWLEDRAQVDDKTDI